MMSDCNLRRPRLARGARYRWDKVRDQHQIVFPESMIVLNETGAAIVPLCDGRTTEELIAEIEQMYPGQDAAGDVHEFLDRLFQRGLLRDADDC